VARIRAIKPVFYRHKKLQQLETEHMALRPMLTFAGLWSVADREGRFEWDPETLKLDILPFVPFSIGQTMNLLHQHKFIFRYEVNGRVYGFIPTFVTHQRPNNKEVQSIIPEPPAAQLQQFLSTPLDPEKGTLDLDKASLFPDQGEQKGTDIGNRNINGNGEREQAAAAAPEAAPVEPEPEPLTDPSATAHHALTVINTQGIILPVGSNMRVARDAAETCHKQGMAFTEIAELMIRGAPIYAASHSPPNWYSFFANALFLHPEQLGRNGNGNGANKSADIKNNITAALEARAKRRVAGEEAGFTASAVSRAGS